jgi:FAD/FMN-containing dehydrogenase
VPVASRTLVLTFSDSASQSRAVAAVAASQLEPVAFDIHAQTPAGAGFTAMLRFASLPGVVDAQLDRARILLAPEVISTTVVEGAAEVEAWYRHSEQIWAAAGAIVRASWLPANLAVVNEELDRLSSAAPVKVEIVGRAAVGAGLIRIDADIATQTQFIERLRASSTFGNTVIRRGSDDLKSRVDVWGSQGDRLPLLTSLKRAFDPQGILAPGRGPL